MRVKNLNGTSDSPKCPCGTWLKHWERYAGKKANYCSEGKCSKPAEIGAHIQKTSGEQSWYIVPLCTEHNNQRGQELTISDDITLVPATARNKCSS